MIQGIIFEKDGTQNYWVFQSMYRYIYELLGLVMTVTFITGNVKDCLMKKLILLKHLIIA